MQTLSAFTIISAAERTKETKGIKGCIFGKSGIGKTSLLHTLPAEKTLFVDLEAGALAVESWQGDTIRPRTWQECRHLAVLLRGPNPSLKDGQVYSHAHYAAACKLFDISALDKYETIFIDSITVASRLCLQWCKAQPQAVSEKSGKPDTRAAYALLGQEMVEWLTTLQHTGSKNIWLVGILEERLDEFGHRIYTLQLEGSKISLELPGILDEIITMAEIKSANGKLHRAFICHTPNEWRYPAKDRSGRLSLLEEPHLGKLMIKIKSKAKPIEERLEFVAPDTMDSPITESPSKVNLKPLSTIQIQESPSCIQL